MRSCRAAILVTLVCCADAHAGPAAADRATRFARLPDWTGIWQSAAWNLDISGRPSGGEAELRAMLQLILPPPYNAKWQAIYDAGSNDAAALARDATFKACTRSFPALMEGPWMFEIALLPEETLLVFENGQVRHIHTDGRQHPDGDNIWPTQLGDSIGHWEDTTLVIDTVARKSEPLAPRASRSVLSEAAHFTERLRRVSREEIDDELTIDDPTTLAHSWRLILKFKRLADVDRLLPYDCTENDRNPVVDGKMLITPR